MNIEKAQLIYIIRKMRLRYEKETCATAKKHGLSLAEALTLLFFAENPNHYNAKDIVALRGFSKAYVSKALSSLSEKKLIDVTRDKSDHRFQHVKINEKANEIVAELQMVQKQKHAIICKGISKKEMDMFLATANKMIQNVIKEEGIKND